MRRLLLIVIPAILIGCQGGGDDGVDHTATSNAQAPLLAAAKKAGGDWSKLSGEEQKLFLERARGNEAAAKSMVGMMAGGAPGGPPKH